MLTNYRFKVYSEYANKHIIISMSASSKGKAIKEIRSRMEWLDKVKPKLSDFELLSENTLNVSLDKKYKTRGGKRVELYNIGSKSSSPVIGNIILKEKPLRTEYTGWTIHGEYLTMEHEHKNDLIEVK